MRHSDLDISASGGRQSPRLRGEGPSFRDVDETCSRQHDPYGRSSSAGHADRGGVIGASEMSTAHTRTSRLSWVAGVVIAAAFTGATPSTAVDQKAEDAAQTVFIDFVESHWKEKAWDGGILAREIVRQAFWLAATDAGLIVRDAALRESPPVELGDGRHLTIDVTPTPGNSVKIRITDKTEKEVWTNDLPLTPNTQFYYVDLPDLITRAEALSRAGFVEAIKAAGIPVAERVEPKDAPLPSAIRDKLDKMSIVDQFAALREIHKAMQEQGQSSAILGGLTRGYANLGDLTGFFWNSTPKVFLARSLLCAERFMVAYQASREARWHRAYARAMTGMHGAALGDLRILANQASESNDDGGESMKDDPPWAMLLRPLCEYRTSDLKKAAKLNKTARLLATYMALLTVEFSGEKDITLKIGHEVLSEQPDCFRVYDVMCDVGGVSNLHRATMIGPEALGKTFLSRLNEIPGLPSSAKPKTPSEAEQSRLERIARQLAQADDEDEESEETDRALAGMDAAGYCVRVPGVVKALVHGKATSKDAGQPSWQTLGRIIEELLFIQMYRRAEFMVCPWNVSPHEFIVEAFPLIKAHPYAGVVRAMDMDARVRAAEMMSVMQSIKVVDANLNMEKPFSTILFYLSDPGMNLRRSIWRDATYHIDPIAGDVCSRMARTQGDKRKAWADLLRDISPQSPMVFANYIETDWENCKNQIVEWEPLYIHHVTFAKALAQKYSELKEYKKAEACLRKYIRKSPDYWAFKLRADNALAQGNRKRWRSTLEDFLKCESHGLEDVSARCDIADFLMSEGKYKEALPYAEQAAQSWAFRGMDTALRCNEALERWDDAERWAKRLGDRYDLVAMKWFLWCKRTGRGHLEAAARDAERRLDSLTSSEATPPPLNQAGTYYLLTKRPKKALATFERSYKLDGDLLSGMFVATIQDSLGLAEDRDRILNAMSVAYPEKPDEPASPMVQLINLMQEHLTSDGEGAMSVSVVERIVEHSDKMRAANMWYFAGCFFQARNDEDQARECMLCSAGNTGATTMTQIIASDWLRERKIDFKVSPPGPQE